MDFDQLLLKEMMEKIEHETKELTEQYSNLSAILLELESKWTETLSKENELKKNLEMIKLNNCQKQKEDNYEDEENTYNYDRIQYLKHRKHLLEVLLEEKEKVCENLDDQLLVLTDYVNKTYEIENRIEEIRCQLLTYSEENFDKAVNELDKKSLIFEALKYRLKVLNAQRKKWKQDRCKYIHFKKRIPYLKDDLSRLKDEIEYLTQQNNQNAKILKSLNESNESSKIHIESTEKSIKFKEQYIQLLEKEIDKTKELNNVKLAFEDEKSKSEILYQEIESLRKSIFELEYKEKLLDLENSFVQLKNESIRKDIIKKCNDIALLEKKKEDKLSQPLSNIKNINKENQSTPVKKRRPTLAERALADRSKRSKFV